MSDIEAKSWDEAIVALEALVTDQRAMVGDERYGQIVARSVPPQLGPVPAHLAERARSLLEEMLVIEDALAERIDTMARRVRVAGRAASDAAARAKRSPSPAMFVDTSG